MTESTELMTKPMPIQKTTWICPYCGVEYGDYDQALKCTNTPVSPPKFKAGDTVYVLGDRCIGFVQRSVAEYVGAEEKTHLPLYLLNKSVDICSDGEIGCDDYTDGDYWGRPAWERELLQMGQSVNVAGKTVTVCPETIAIF